jgi:hypothetical protein
MKRRLNSESGTRITRGRSDMHKEIEKHLRAYLSGNSSLRTFEDWFLPATWNLRVEKDPGAGALSAEVSLRLAEFDENHLDEQELRDEFEAILGRNGREETSPPSRHR